MNSIYLQKPVEKIHFNILQNVLQKIPGKVLTFAGYKINIMCCILKIELKTLKENVTRK